MSLLRKGLLAAAALLPALAAHGYIEALYPLQQVLAESEVVVEGEVEKVDAANRVCILKVGKALKGKCPYDKIRINVGVGREWHPDVVLPHLVAGAPVVIFAKADRGAQVGMVYLNRFFLQLYADPNSAPDKVWWNFMNVEIRMNRTFHGTVPQLSKLISAVQIGKTKPPPPDPRLPSITRQDVTALPVWGATETDEKSLPPSFRKREPLKPREPDAVPDAVKGVRYDYYEGEWTGPPDFGALKPSKCGVAEQIDLSNRARESGIAFRFTGCIEISKDGNYFFHLNSDGWCRLLVGDTEIAGGFRENAGDIPLKPGKHAFTLLYCSGSGERALSLQIEGPGLSKQAVPASALFHIP
jgi:hypothetical protein